MECFSSEENLLIVQDLDGVCMGLVKDPLTRHLDPQYIQAVQAFDTHFFVLTNGEHLGTRGVNGIVERSLASSTLPRQNGLYLPGLAAGGVQWQDRFGRISHPGVKDEILEFLRQVPEHIDQCLRQFFTRYPNLLSSEVLEQCIRAAILDNVASPTANLNVFHTALKGACDAYQSLQWTVQQFMQDLLASAHDQGLADAFFLHLAPNLGQDEQGNEILQTASEQASGTTDFQLMLRGARKEVGLLFLLNHYVGQRTGTFPLGEKFNVFEAPESPEALLELIQSKFKQSQMPLMVGVGDTVTSQGVEVKGHLEFRRGGSDRGFLELIQGIGQCFDQPNFILYVDSSGGEVQNRKPLKLSEPDQDGRCFVLEGPTDNRDRHDPLTLNVAIPGGHRQYIQIFQQAAHKRNQQCPKVGNNSHFVN